MGFWDNLRIDRPGPKYLAICDAIAEAIESGQLGPGRRLPSHRSLARRLGVSVGTITRAYQEALERGLITGEVGRGSFVRHHTSPPLSVARDDRFPGVRVDLYQNFPVPIPKIEGPAWAEALADLRRGADLASMARSSWSEVSGRNQRAGAEWIRRTGLNPAPQNIIDCPGVQAALCAIVGGTTHPGDVVACAWLSHPGFKALALQYGLEIHGLAIDEQGIEPHAFERLCKELPPRLLYCAPTIHAPTTCTMSAERRRDIAGIAEQFDVLILEDESAAFLLPDPPPPLAAFAPRRCFLVADTWMALSLGLRTTYVLVPEGWYEPLSAAVAATSGVTPFLVAEIASTWIHSDTAERMIEARRAELIARNSMTQEILGRWAVRGQPCGHHVWLELPAPLKAGPFCLQAERRGVAIIGSDWFVVGSAPPPDAVRICIGNAPDREQLRWALRQIDGLLTESAPFRPTR